LAESEVYKQWLNRYTAQLEAEHHLGVTRLYRRRTRLITFLSGVPYSIYYKVMAEAPNKLWTAGDVALVLNVDLATAAYELEWLKIRGYVEQIEGPTPYERVVVYMGEGIRLPPHKEDKSTT
jgi:hypothetical protein